MEIAVCVPLTEAQQVRLRRGAGDATLRLCDPGVILAMQPIVFEIRNRRSSQPMPACVGCSWSSVGFGEYAALDWSRPGGTAQVTNLAGSSPIRWPKPRLPASSRCAGIDRLTGLRTAGDWVGDPVRAELRLRQARGWFSSTGGDQWAAGRIAGAVPSSQDHDLRARLDGRSTDAAMAEADVVVATVPHIRR
ncbi:MAG: hypothetical protein R3D84_08345 [Paracoccaceae bacterium]